MREGVGHLLVSRFIEWGWAPQGARALALQELLAVLHVDLSGHGLRHAATAQIIDGRFGFGGGLHAFDGGHTREGQGGARAGRGSGAHKGAHAANEVGNDLDELTFFEHATLLSGRNCRGSEAALEGIDADRGGAVLFIGVSELDRVEAAP